MSKEFKINEKLSMSVIEGVHDSILTSDFYKNLYDNVFIDDKNNDIAGIIGITDIEALKKQIDTWLNGNSQYMFFLYEGKDIVGTTQAFSAPIFGENILSLGYIVSKKHQGKGYGTTMLRFVSEFLDDLNINIVLGFRDGNVASEKIAAKNNYKYHMRIDQPDQHNEIRPMTYYKYAGKPIMNESYSVIPSSKILTTNQWIDNKSQILSRVNPKMLSLEEYVYLSSSINKPTSLNETYFLFTSAHYKLADKLKKEKVRSKYFGITDKAAKQMFNPDTNGDIMLETFCNLVDGEGLSISKINEDKTSMILESNTGEFKVRLLDNVLMVEEYLMY